MKFNHLKLKGLMLEKGITQKDLAKAIGISAVSLNKKINGLTQFDAEDIVKISKELDIVDLKPYFFTLKV